MAKNWTTAEAVKVVREGKDKAAIQDIGRRFPLFVAAAAGSVEGLLEIIGALPDHQTARKIEAVLKEGVGELEDEEEVEEKPASKKPVKEDKAPKGKKAKKAAEPEEEDDEEEEEEKPKAKKGKKAEDKPAKGGKGKTKKQPDPEPEDEDEDWEDDEDEDEDGDGLDDMSLAELKKEAKKRKVNIKGLKSPKEIIAALRGEDDDEEEDEDDEDWDI